MDGYCVAYSPNEEPMSSARTTITLDPDLLVEVDRLAGPRGRSAFVAEAIQARIRRERLRRAIDATRGALVGTPAWRSAEEVYTWVRAQREDPERP
jgi:metal-responsive CopG/Arc/MetJ family transcriptional regulator